MSKINFPQLFGSILQFNVTQLLNVVAEQEVEKDQLNALVTQLKAGEVEISQIEINKQSGEIRVAMPTPDDAININDATQEQLARKLAELIAKGAPITEPLPAEEEGTELVSPGAFEEKLDIIENLLADPEEIEYKEFNAPDLDEPPENVNYQKPE